MNISVALMWLLDQHAPPCNVSYQVRLHEQLHRKHAFRWECFPFLYLKSLPILLMNFLEGQVLRPFCMLGTTLCYDLDLPGEAVDQ